MTRREFELPDVGEGVAEGTLEAWLVDVGDRVSEDQPLAEVETDKALVEVPSPVNGTIAELHAEAGDVVPVGDVIVTFELDEGESGAGTKAEADPDPDPESEPAPESTTDDADATATADGSTADDGTAETPAAGNGTAAATESSTGRVFAAPSTRRLARELGVDLERVEGTGPGGRVTEADVRQAAADDEPAGPGSGTDTDTDTDTATAATDTAEPGSTATPTEDVIEAPPAVESADRERTLAAPATRRVANEEGVDIDSVPAVEHREGEAFVTAEAVREYAEQQRRAQEAEATALATRGEDAVEPVEEPAGAGDAEAESRRVGTAQREEREPYSGVRRTIGKQMERSKYTAPHVTHHDDVDVTELVETRERLKPVAEERGVRLTYMPFVMKACVAALKEFPYVNAQLDEENEEIVKKRYYNLGVATATDAGLMVPVVDDVDQKGVLEIARETNDLVERTRERSVSRDELQGGTFTITNVGGIGGEYATPIVNYPEVAILALGAIEKKPRVVGEGEDEHIEARHVLPLSLSFDHRVVDGAVGARFTNAVKRYLADPDLLLLE